MTSKTRSGLTMSGRYYLEYMSDDNVVAQFLRTVSLPYNERTISFSHKWPVKRGTVDSGGSFSNQVTYWPPDGFRWVSVRTKAPVGLWRRYNGPIWAYNCTGGSVILPTLKSAGVLNALGTTAISRVSPTNPLNGLGQFLGELRQLPTVSRISEWKAKAKSFLKLSRKGSSEYLAVQFGWVPFLKEIYNVALTAMDHGKIIAQYDRDSGRSIRRRYTFPDDSSTVVTNLPNSAGSPVLETNFYDAQGTCTRERRTETSSWFSGAFTYYLPPANSPQLIDRMKRAERIAKRLYGARISPQTLYQLAPWSWALGWVTNANDIVNNWSNFTEDGLVMRYGYIMTKTTVTDTYTLVGLTFKNQQPMTLSQKSVSCVKQRARATPYGFGLNASGFNLKQWSIIAALGISKAPRSLDF